MKRIWFLALIMTGALFLAGCSVRNVTRGMEEGEHYDAVISVKGNAEGAAQETAAPEGEEGALPQEAEQLDALFSLLSVSDEEAAEMFGGGEENRTADGKLLVGRNYETELFGLEAHLYTSYDENGQVGMIFLEMPEGEADRVLEILTGFLGSFTALTEETEGSGWRWDLEDCVLTLYEIEGTVCIDLVPADAS